MSRNEFLKKKIFKKIKIYLKNLKSEYFFFSFLGRLNILLNETALFDHNEQNNDFLNK